MESLTQIKLPERPNLGTLACLAISLWSCYWICVFVYRITLHPLAKFPGPKLAAVSFWYEFFYDVWPLRYKYMWNIEEMHKKYGPIVRINPIHLHIHDPSFLDEIYAGSNRKRNRDPWYMHWAQEGTMGWSLLQSMDHDLHRKRRAALNPFFSKRNIQQLEPMIMEKVNRLLDRLDTAFVKGEVVNLSYATAALTMDVISSYALGADVGNLNRADWGKDWLDAFRLVGQFRPIGRQFKWFINMSATVSPDIVQIFNPRQAFVMRKLNYPMESIRQAIRDRNEDGKPSQDNPSTNSKTIFQDIIDSNLPPSEKSAGRLNAEAGLMVGAGTETTARSLSVTIFYLLENPSTLQRLRSEFETLQTRDFSVADLEGMPYFNAVVSEGLRLAHGVSSRQPRIAPDEDLRYGEWVIPAGTAVMQSMYLHHMNSTIFPDPFKFEPQRWLDDPKLKSQYLVAFGRGSRSCIGMNLANAEIYLTLAHLLRKFDLQLVDTIENRDVKTIHDCFIGTPDLRSQGIKVKVVRQLVE